MKHDAHGWSSSRVPEHNCWCVNPQTHPFLLVNTPSLPSRDAVGFTMKFLQEKACNSKLKPWWLRFLDRACAYCWRLWAQPRISPPEKLFARLADYRVFSTPTKNTNNGRVSWSSVSSNVRGGLSWFFKRILPWKSLVNLYIYMVTIDVTFGGEHSSRRCFKLGVDVCSSSLASSFHILELASNWLASFFVTT